MCSSTAFQLNIISILLITSTLLHHNTVATSSPFGDGGNTTDLIALLAFKSMVLHDPLGALTSWNSSLHFCHWEGVVCSNRHARVVSLNLPSKGLVGSLSPFIGNLSFLREIDLANNSFPGDIPPQLGHLLRLQTLSLPANFLQGKIPSALSNCSHLINLFLNHNHLIGDIPSELGSLLELKNLFIHVNNLTGGIPPSIGNLTSLESFGVTYNQLMGTLPNSLGQLTNLKELTAGANYFSGVIPPSVFNLSLLTIFSLPDNQFQGTLPQALGSTLPNLQGLQLGSNQLSGSLPLSLSNASQLQRFDISLNYFTGKISIDFGNLQQLWGLVLGGNVLGSGEPDEMSFLTSLSNCSNLHVVELRTNQLRGALPSNPGNFSTNFFYFSLVGNQVYGNIPSWIGDLPGLTQLLLSDNEISGTLPSSIGNLYKLQRFTLHNNSLSGELPSSIGRLTLLNELTLNKNRFQSIIPPSLGNCRNLQLLDLSDNNFSGSIPNELFAISTLSQSLNLSHNHLSGALPVEMGNLVHLVELDVSDNDLSSEIPSSLGRCISLVNLFLDGNSFQGSLPLSLSSPRGMKILDLSRNNFSGKIPQFLKTFSLISLNLSYNDFEGEVPKQGVFSNFSAISVVGNTRLCGGISELKLPRCINDETNKRKAPLIHTILITVIICAIGGVILVSSFVYFFRFNRKTKGQSMGLQLKEPFLNLSYDTLLKATHGFSSMNLLGSGSFGSVYKGILDFNHDQRAVAVKVFKLQHAKASKSFVAECEALRVVRHRNLIKVLSSCSSIDFQGNDFKALIYEFMPNGSLEMWLHTSSEAADGQDEPRVLNHHQRIKIALDVAFAVDYLHNQCEIPIVHCDLKPSNVLLDSDNIACVGDFGLAKFVPQPTDQQQSSSVGLRGSVGYAAPEYGLGSEVTTKGDMYSYGILLLEMMTGKRPTDPMFQEGLDLHKFAEISFPDHVIEVLDPIFLQHFTREQASTSDGINQRARETSRASRVEACFVSMIKMGVACSMDSPRDRMDITDVINELRSILGILERETLTGIS